MSNKFAITITAVDKATKTIRNINKSITSTFRPIQQMGRNMKMMGRELHFDKIGKGIGFIARGAVGLGRSIGALATPMAAVFGVGSLAGIAAFAAKWAQAGFSLDRVATTIGISTKELGSFRSAAELAGVSGDEMQQSMANLAQIMRDLPNKEGDQSLWALIGGNNIRMNKLPNGNSDVITMLSDIADRTAKLKDPQSQLALAKKFGLESILPILRRGSSEIERLRSEAEKTGSVMSNESVEGAVRFTTSLNNLKSAIHGTANELAENLYPWLTKVTDAASKFLTGGGDRKNTPVAKTRRFFDELLNGTPGFKNGRATTKPSPLSDWWSGVNEWSERGRWKRYPAETGAPASSKSSSAIAVDRGSVERRLFSPTPNESDSDRLRILQGEFGRSQNPLDKAALAREIQSIRVEVSMKNAPPGTTVRATTASGMQVPTRIQYAMPAGGLP